MPNFEAHQKLVTKNQQMLNLLDLHLDQHSEWVVTVAFYKAVHLVESMFASEPRPFHSSDHFTRLDRLKQTKQFAFIYKNFRPLYAASLVARYLEGSGKEVNEFSEYLTPVAVKETMVNHHLKQIVHATEKQISSNNAHRQQLQD